MPAHLRLTHSLLPLLTLLLVLALPRSTHAVKFVLPPARLPAPKCVWNAAHTGALVIVTAHVAGPGVDPGAASASTGTWPGLQRVDVEIVDSTLQRNVLLSKRDLRGETRLAVTAHAEGDVGVCFRNWQAPDVKGELAHNMSRTVDLDVDVGADAVDYNAIANQESLSGLETEMRKLEGIVKEVVDELEYLKEREERFALTNLSTNERVGNFAWFILVSLVALGTWEILHLRAFFKRKYLID